MFRYSDPTPFTPDAHRRYNLANQMPPGYHALMRALVKLVDPSHWRSCRLPAKGVACAGSGPRCIAGSDRRGHAPW